MAREEYNVKAFYRDYEQAYRDYDKFPWRNKVGSGTGRTYTDIELKFSRANMALTAARKLRRKADRVKLSYYDFDYGRFVEIKGW